MTEQDRGQPDLLRTLLPQLLDPGYERAAARRGGRPARGPSQLVALVLGALLVGVVLGVSAADAAARAPGAEQARRGLLSDVHDAEQRTDGLAVTAQELGERLNQAQRQALAGNAQGEHALAQVHELELAAATVAVTGPGLRITVTDDGAKPTVLDRDLQVLVNDVWACGAEAVTLGGVRLHPRATVRQAGGAVLVDNRPVAQPYVLQAIGDPADLHTRLVNTDGYGRFATFTQVYGIGFTVQTAPSLTLSAAVAAEPTLAEREGER